MAHKPERPAYHVPEGSTARVYRLASYGSPVAEPSPADGRTRLLTAAGDQARRGTAPLAIKPGVDERLVIPEAGEEYIDGVRYEVMDWEPEHNLGEMPPCGE